MYRNIFITSLRYLLKNRIYSLMIILSLGTGFMVASLLVAFIVHELKTDSFHRNRNRICRVVSDDPFDQGHQLSFIPESLGKYLSGNYPEIAASTLMYTINHQGLSNPVTGREIDDLTVLAVDSSFFEIFDFPVDPQSMQDPVRPDHMMLTAETVAKLWNDMDVTGKMATLATDTGEIPFLISGIIDRTLQNSHLVFDALVFYGDFENLWGGINYIMLMEGADPKVLESKINQDNNTPDMLGAGKMNYFLQELRDVYFDENNTRRFSKARDEIFIWISWTVVFLVLFLAGFNFLNLFFLSFRSRWKEFGMKKVMGAAPSVFRATAIIEVGLYLGLSLLLSVLLILWLIPFFNQLLETSLTLKYFLNPEIMLISSGMILMIALMVILRITGYLYAGKPISLTLNSHQQKIRVNRLMLKLQFIISGTLIIASVVMIRQMDYIRKKPLGFNKNLFEIRLPHNLPEAGAGPEVLKDRISRINGVEKLTLCSGNPISDNMIARYDLDDGSYYTPYIFYGDADFKQTLGLELITGHFPGIGSKGGKVVNEAFLSHFGIASPEEAPGRKIPGTKEDYITGVVRDFNIGSLSIRIPPVIISHSKESSALIAKIHPGKIASVTDEAGQIWKELYPGRSYRYLWIDEEILTKHREDYVFSRIIIVSSIISILISCFGIFALSWGTSVDRLREIGIRKVLGASGSGIFFMLSGSYLRHILISFIIAVPLAYYLADRWLNKFIYKIDISISLFLLAAGIILFITLITISFQTLRVSLINPVNVLKHE